MHSTAPPASFAPPDARIVPGADAMFDVLVLAELNLDVVMTTDQPVRFGQVEQWVDGGALTLGSSGAITAAALAALGRRVAICGTVGDDQGGTMVLAALTDLGVDVSAVVRLAGRRTGLTVVLTRSDGDRAMLTYPGTMPDFTAAMVPVELLARCRHLHISSIFLQPGLQEGLPGLLAGRPAGVTASLDPGWDPDGSWTAVVPVLGQLDWLLPNANECRAIAGSPALSVADAARTLADHGVSVAVKMGYDGALACTADGSTVVTVAGAARVPVDTTGAGDNFDAGFLSALLPSTTQPAVTPPTVTRPTMTQPTVARLRSALAAGCACGAISVGGTGGTGRLATAEEAATLAQDILERR